MDEFDDVPDLIPDLIEIDTTPPTEPSPKIQPNSEAAPTLESIGKPPNRRVVPLTILTGWLGSGKTTLLHNLLDSVSSAGKTMAILQNETSELMGVEKALRLQDDSGVFGQVLEIKNGCVCCSVKSDFLLAIDTLLEKASFDYVVVECSGIADVGVLATQLWVDDDQEARVYLDGIVCVVDAAHIHKHMGWKSTNLTHVTDDASIPVSSEPTATAGPVAGAPKRAGVVYSQLIHADTVLLNKIDTIGHSSSEDMCSKAYMSRLSSISLPANVSLAPHLRVTDQIAVSPNDVSVVDNVTATVKDICQRIRQVNPSAPVVLTTQSKIDVSMVLGLKAFRLGHHMMSCLSSRSNNNDNIDHNQKKSVKMSSVRGDDMTELEPVSITLPTGKTVLLYTAHEGLRREALNMSGVGVVGTANNHNHHPHPHLHAVDHTHDHAHTDSNSVSASSSSSDADADADHGIATIVIRGDSVSLQSVKKWLVDLLWSRQQAESVEGWRELRERLREGDTEIDDREVSQEGMDIFRIKGVLSIHDKNEKYYLQAVMDTFDLAPADHTVGIDIIDKDIDSSQLDADRLRLTSDFRNKRQNSGDVWQEGEERHSSIIIIGVDLDVTTIVKGFAECFE